MKVFQMRIEKIRFQVICADHTVIGGTTDLSQMGIGERRTRLGHFCLQCERNTQGTNHRETALTCYTLHPEKD